MTGKLFENFTSSSDSDGFTLKARFASDVTVRINSDIATALSYADEYVRKTVGDILLSIEGIDDFLAGQPRQQLLQFGLIEIFMMRRGGIFLSFNIFRDEGLIELSTITTPDHDGGGPGDGGGKGPNVPLELPQLDLVARNEFSFEPCRGRRAARPVGALIGRGTVVPIALLRLLRDLEVPPPPDGTFQIEGKGGFRDSGVLPDCPPNADFRLARKEWQVADICGSLSRFGRQGQAVDYAPLAPCPQLGAAAKR